MEKLHQIDNSLFKFYLHHFNPKPFKLYLSQIIENNKENTELESKSYVTYIKSVIENKASFDQNYYLNHFIRVSECEYRYLKSSAFNFVLGVFNYIVFLRLNKRSFVFMDNNRYIMNNMNKVLFYCSVVAMVHSCLLCLVGFTKWLIYLGFKNSIILDEEKDIISSIKTYEA